MEQFKLRIECQIFYKQASAARGHCRCPASLGRTTKILSSYRKIFTYTQKSPKLKTQSKLNISYQAL